MNKIQIGHSEAIAFTILMLGTKNFLGYPRLVTEWGLTAGWLVVLLSGIASIILWLLITGLLARFPGKSLTEITKVAFGPILGSFVNISTFLYILIISGIYLRLFSEQSILTALPEMPAAIIALVYILASWLAAYYGVEAIFRCAYFSFSLIAIGVILVLLLLYPYYDLKMLLPLTGPGVLPVLKSSVMGITAFSEVVLLTFFVRFFPFNNQRLKKVGVFSICFIMFFFVTIVGVYQMVFPYPTGSEVLAPFYQLTRTIFLGHYLQRVEAVFVIFWAFTAFLRIAAGVMIGAVILQDTLKLSYYRPLLPVICLLVYTIAFTSNDQYEILKLEGEVRMVYGWLISFVLTLIILAFASILRKGEDKTNDSQN